jgi:hypothetical protein
MENRMENVDIINILIALKKENVIIDEEIDFTKENNYYCCNICKTYTTTFKWSIKRHIESHRKYFIHKCNKCLYKSNEKSHLIRHKNSFGH